LYPIKYIQIMKLSTFNYKIFVIKCAYLCGLGFSFYAVTPIFSSIQTVLATDDSKFACLIDWFASRTIQIIVERSSSLFPSLFHGFGSHSVS
jgi:hypothetical protein